MARLRKILIVFFSILLISEAYSQTSVYVTAGIGKSEVKVLKLHHGGLGNTFNPNFYQIYEIGVGQNITRKFSLKAGGGFATYSCTIGLPEGFEPPEGYFDKIGKFYYVSVPIGIKYNPKWGIELEAGAVNNFFVKYTDDEMQFFYNVKEYTFIPYWGLSYTFFDMLELGYVKHLYLSKFADYSNWWEQTHGIEPSIFFKYNVWYVYASFKIRLSKRDE